MPFDLMVKLKALKHLEKLSKWYDALPREDKKRVIREGELQQEDNGFFPDVSFD
ncbi:MAG: hypothetical protein QM768_16860 [Agriterribacter sp.]